MYRGVRGYMRNCCAFHIILLFTQNCLKIRFMYRYIWASLVAQLVKNLPAMWETCVRSLGWEDALEREKLPTPVFWPGEFHGCIDHGVTKSQT